jgi:hypothetical protein
MSQGKWSESEQGHTFASSKVSLSVFSDSPDIPDTIDGADILMNGTPSSCTNTPHVSSAIQNRTHPLEEEKMSDKRAKRTPAIAFANSVLPHPGGPCNNTPLGGCTPVCR